MSTNWNIACRDCKAVIRIGEHTTTKNAYLYSDPNRLDAFKDFLFEHVGHKLVFGNTTGLRSKTYSEKQVTADRQLAMFSKDLLNYAFDGIVLKAKKSLGHPSINVEYKQKLHRDLAFVLKQLELMDDGVMLELSGCPNAVMQEPPLAQRVADS